MANGEKPAPSDTPTIYIKSRHDDGPTSSKPLPGFKSDDLVGRTFLLPPGDNGERLRAKVTRKVVEDIEQSCNQESGRRGEPKSICLDISSLYLTKRHWNLTKTTTTPKGQMGFKKQANHKCTSQSPKRVNLIFAVKHDGRDKARLVADGSLTPEPVENIYSGVVSLRHLRLVIFLGELNNLEFQGADIGNAYLEDYTHEKLFIIAGPEFE